MHFESLSIWVLGSCSHMTLVAWLQILVGCSFGLGFVFLCLLLYVRADVLPLFIGSNFEQVDTEGSNSSTGVDPGIQVLYGVSGDSNESKVNGAQKQVKND
jgi:hypothetical protein